MMEEWKDINDYEGLYRISNYGNVYNIKTGKVLKWRISRHPGYYHITLVKNKKQKTAYIHRLVAETFIPNPNYLPQVNHIDGNKLNNNVNNLEWITNRDNQLHAISLGLTKERDNKLSKKIDCYDKDMRYIKSYISISSASKETNISRTNINSVCLGQRKTAGGLIWKYQN